MLKGDTLYVSMSQLQCETLNIWVVLTSALRAMVKESISGSFVLEIQVFTFVLVIITQLFVPKLLSLVL